MLIKLSSYNYIRGQQINGCELFQKEDNCWYVKWSTDEGEITSDAHTGKTAATNYIREISKTMTDYEKECEE
jgi:hypothetical protein